MYVCNDDLSRSIPHDYKVRTPVTLIEPAPGRTGQLSAAEGSGENKVNTIQHCKVSACLKMYLIKESVATVCLFEASGTLPPRLLSQGEQALVWVLNLNQLTNSV